MEKNIYHILQERIDSYALGFPSTESGVEMRILERLFTPDQAQMYLHMTRDLEPVSVIAQRAGKPQEETAVMLKQMTAKGVTFPKTVDNIQFYAAAPFMHGFFENNAWLQEDKELAALMEQYLTGGFVAKGKALRTIPVNQSMADSKTVLPFDDVMKIIDSKDRIGVMPCACAKHMQTLETGCPRPLEVCIGFDFYAEYCIEGLGVGRWIDRKEARTILKKANEAGLVHQSGGNSMSTECLCNCCPDCCGSMKIFKQIAAPSKIAGSNYQAHLSEDDCILCEACIDRCPMGALTMSEEVLLLNLQKCIGCGLCTTQCPSGGITLIRKERDRPIEPPSPENYIFMKPSAEFEKDIKKWMKNT